MWCKILIGTLFFTFFWPLHGEGRPATIRWKAVSEASGYMVVVATMSGETVFSSRTNEEAITVRLPPGRYRYSVLSLNLFGRPSRPGQWLLLDIAAPKTSPKEIEKEDHCSERCAALWRSALLPGYGQYHLRRERSAFAIGSVFAGLSLLFLDQRRVYLASLQDYRELDSPSVLASLLYTGNPLAGFSVYRDPAELMFAMQRYENQKDAVKTHYRRLSEIGTAMALLYAFNLLEIAFPSGSLSFSAKGVGFSYTARGFAW